MSAPAKPQPVTVIDSRVLYHLAPGTKITELSGRQFEVGARPGTLWHGSTFCTVEALELPVVVTQ